MILLFGEFFVINLDIQAQFYDGLQVKYGKNRVQYREFNWQYHSVGEFEVYYYQGGHELAGHIVRIIETTSQSLRPYFNNNIEGPIQILVYNNQTEFKQSNIGVFQAEDESQNIGGTAKIIGNKLFLFGKGDRRALERDLRSGLARIALQQTIFKGDWQDALRNSSTLQMPDWFIEGLVNYIAVNESAEANVHLFDSAHSGALSTIDRSKGKEAGELGLAVWDYIADVYGVPAIANVLYMLRISRNVEDGFRFATGLNLSELIDEVIDYQTRQTPINYFNHFPNHYDRKSKRVSVRDGGELPFKLKKRYNYISIKASPDGKTIAFITDERGQIRVWTSNTEDKKVTRRAQHGHKLDILPDDLSPYIAWHPDGTQFTYSISKKGQPLLVTVRLDDDKVIKKDLFRIDQVLSMDYSPDGRSIVFSGMVNGRSDLYIYRVIGNLQEPLWADRFDDLHPRFTEDGKSIIFSSNRPDPVLRGDLKNIPFRSPLDLYLCHINEKEPRLERLVHTPQIDERYPIPLQNGEFVFLSENEGGFQETKWGWADSTILSIDTIIRYRHFIDTRTLSKLDTPILTFNCDTASKICWGTTTSMRHAFRLNIGDMPSSNQRSSGVYLHDDASISPYNTENDYFTPPNWSVTFDSTDADFNNYEFEFEKRIRDSNAEKENKKANKNPSVLVDLKETLEEKRLKPSNYRRNFALEKLQSQISNAFGSQFYRAYDGAISTQPGLGNASEIRVSDLFDDLHIIGGFNIPANLNNSLLGLAFYNLEGRVDKMLSFQRQGTTNLDPINFSLVESQSHTIKYRLSYPIDEVRSLRASLGLRLDRAVTQGTEMFSLLTPNAWAEQIGLHVAWVHDDTRNPALNIREGLRAKIWLEYYLDRSKIGITEDGLGSSFGTIGFDFRRYFKLYANSIFAIRTAANWSIGQVKLLHLLGGTDNSLAISNNYGTPIDPDQSYAYQASITPLRGFANNARNGTHAAIINAEIRIPVWSTIFPEPAKTDFIRNLQLIGFYDIGSAWTGVHPYSGDNTFNSTVYENNPVTVTIDNNREPILYDWGWGLRSRMLGYWVSADWAWGVDDSRILPRRFALSLNFDF